VTDFLVSQTNNAASLPASDTWQKESYTTHLIAHPEVSAESSKEINLREALEWLLGSPEPNHDLQLSEEERASRKERRLDLLMWIMNLEVRLTPYREPA
jgi:hypothetical protein